MQRLDKGRREAAAIDRAAGIAGIDLVAGDALADEIHADLEIGDEHGAGLLQDGHGVADMVVVAMGEEHMRDAFGRAFPAARPGRIAGKERIDQDLRPVRSRRETPNVRTR